MRPTIVLFTRDLRAHDHPALSAAAERGPVLPLFVLDDAALGAFGAANRVRFLLESLADLRASLRSLGGELWIRRGDAVTELVRVAHDIGATAVNLTSDASAFARSRLERLVSSGLDVTAFPGISVVEPGVLAPDGGDHYRVFAPHMRAWMAHPKRRVLPMPERLEVADGPAPGEIPHVGAIGEGPLSPDVVSGGAAAGRQRASSWDADGIHSYAPKIGKRAWRERG